MIRAFLTLAALLTLAGFSTTASAQQRADYQSMAAFHAKENSVPYDLVHRIIMRESKYDAALLGRGGAIGLMQIKLATARGVGYSGTAKGLRDPNTNLTYGVKYLAGAYRAAHGDHNRAVRYYAGGYYYVAKQQRHAKPAAPLQSVLAKDNERAPMQETANAQATNAQAQTPRP